MTTFIIACGVFTAGVLLLSAGTLLGSRKPLKEPCHSRGDSACSTCRCSGQD